MARPTKFNEERAKTLVGRLRQGHTRKASAEDDGISYDSFLGWLKKSRSAKTGEFFQFFGALTHAEAEAEKRHSDTLQKAADGYDATIVTRTIKTVIRMKK